MHLAHLICILYMSSYEKTFKSIGYPSFINFLVIRSVYLLIEVLQLQTFLPAVWSCSVEILAIFLLSLDDRKELLTRTLVCYVIMARSGQVVLHWTGPQNATHTNPWVDLFEHRQTKFLFYHQISPFCVCQRIKQPQSKNVAISLEPLVGL